MNILIIKQTSLGDVLHSTGHVRAVKTQFPDSKLTLLTATSSYDIYRHNPYVDRVILFDRYAVKRNWCKQPGWALRHIGDVLREVRAEKYDLAIDLQGRMKSMLFLYLAHAKRKFAKGRWLWVPHFAKPGIHAIEEMDGVLKLAGIDTRNTTMEIHVSPKERSVADDLLNEINPQSKPLVIVSPFTRWHTKDWGIDNFKTFCTQMPDDVTIVFTGSDTQRAAIDDLIARLNGQSVVNLAGQLNLLEFAALIQRSVLLVSGDSFPMHLASAMGRPLIALFGPTDETRVGPRSASAVVMRASNNCRRCYRRSRCPYHCIGEIRPADVIAETVRILHQDDVATSG